MHTVCAWIALLNLGLLPPPGAPAAGEPSGSAWVAKFPGSREVADLEDDFEAKVGPFLEALAAAGAKRRITSTLRPPERAYLMHWSWKIALKDFDPREVPARDGVEIDWWHGDAATSKAKAREMVDGYGIDDLGVPPALNSRHTAGKAIDLLVSWSGDLEIAREDGTLAKITSAPRDHTNPDLIEVARTYGVIHFSPVARDKVHWSTDGR